MKRKRTPFVNRIELLELPDECLFEIVKWVEWGIGFSGLLFSCKRIYSLITSTRSSLVKHWKQRAMERFTLPRLSHDQQNKLLELVKRDGGIIAGGTVLRNFLNADWTPGDIDIFFDGMPSFLVNKEPCKELIEFLTNVFGKPDSDRSSEYKTWESKHDKCECSIYRLVSWNGKVQLIFLGTKNNTPSAVGCSPSWDFMKHITDHFDLSCCKCWTDGTEMFVASPFTTWQGISVRSYIEDNTPKRDEKYKERGFSILNH
jgi:hypothetical protein